MSESKAPNVGLAGAIMMASLFLSRILGLVRESVIAGMFGSNQLTDAYKLSFSVPDLLFFLIAGGALSSAFIPVFSEYLHSDREQEAWHVFSVVVTVMSLVVLAFIGIAWIFALPLSHLIAPGKSGQVLELISHCSRIILPAQFAFFIGGIMFGTLYARQRFVAPGMGPNVYNIGIIFGAVVISHFVQPGIIGMSWGALIGAMVGNLVIPFFVMRKLGATYFFSLDVKHEGVKKVFRLMLPVVLGLSLPAVYQLIMQNVASSAHGGFNSNLDYANRLMQAPLAIFGQSLAIAVFPALSQFIAQNRLDMYRNQIAQTMRTVIYITIPISALMLVLSPEIVSIVYQRGAFTSTSAAEVTACLQLFCVGIFAWCLHPVLMRGFFAMQSVVVPIVWGTITTVLFVILILTLRQTSLGYFALPLCSSISAIFLVIALLAVLKQKAKGLDISGLLATLGKSAFASLIAFGLLYALMVAVPSLGVVGSHGSSMLKLTVGGLISAWVYYAITRAFKMPETEVVSRALARLDRKRA